MQALFFPAEMACLIRPETFSSLVVCVQQSILNIYEQMYHRGIYLHIECSIEAHLKLILIVLVEHSQETLFEDQSSK